MIILPRIGEFREPYPHIDVVISSGDRLIYALYPFHRQLSPRVRGFIDWARDVYDEKFGPLKQHKHAR